MSINIKLIVEPLIFLLQRMRVSTVTRQRMKARTLIQEKGSSPQYEYKRPSESKKQGSKCEPHFSVILWYTKESTTKDVPLQTLPILSALYDSKPITRPADEIPSATKPVCFKWRLFSIQTSLIKERGMG